MTCEVCWDLAYVRSRTRGGSQADHYRRLLIETEGWPGHTEADRAVPTPGETA